MTLPTPVHGPGRVHVARYYVACYSRPDSLVNTAPINPINQPTGYLIFDFNLN